MNKKDFMELVSSKAPPDLKGSEELQQATEYVLQQEGGKAYKSNIPNVMSLARMLKTNNSKEKGEKEIILKRESLLVSDYLAKKITPWVEGLRFEIFNDKQPPFNDIEAAAEWIENQHKDNKQDNEAFRKRSNAYFLISNMAKENNIEVAFKRSRLLYPKVNAPGYIFPIPGTTLSKICKEVKKMSDMTGFRKQDLTVFILTGIEPVFNRFNAMLTKVSKELPTGGRIKRNSLTIEINSADLKFNELKEIYSKYKEILNIKRKKPLTKKHEKLYQIIKRKGGYPTSGKGATDFWREVTEDFNNTLPENEKYSTWVGVYKLYKRIENNFENIFS